MAGGSATGPAPEGGGILGTLDRLIFRIERAFALIAALCIFALMLIAVGQITARKLFNAPLYGYIDMVEIAMTTFAFLGIAYAERLGGHIRMELLIGKLKGRGQWIAELIGVLLALVVMGVLIYYGYEHAMRAYLSGDSTIDAQYPWWPSKMMVPIAFSLLWLRLLLSAVAYTRLIIWPDAEPVAVHVPETLEQMAEREAREAVHEIGSPESRGER
ncbi:MAG: TRAP transporter small permease subunit [Hyphomicrobiaceae bacterium]